ncbi:NAD(P)H-binding protein [Pseudodonghicola flavimaris]|uniref:NAD(P)H-binding protein n=1 Tax=Pseudodonghicola flavimaris TaxID=3050036 RepID=A0ABT7F2G9_9RHOB|nr:NAD(P)H-binding protein [Pseudodonghicola flavimaris]MDK3018796.1 NAD(P)H-binding protein [Pseudodonghicola flavimaris]
MKILIIGATGGIGHRLLPMLVANGHEVVGLHRKPEQADAIRTAGAVPCPGDIIDMSVAEIAAAAQSCDAIVFSAGAAGSGLDRTTAIDGDGPIKTVAAARALGISRLYLVSAFPESARQKERNPRFEHYMAEKKRADVAVASSELDWVIVRPGTLQHEDGDGRVSLGPAVAYGNVARGNVARVLAGLIERPDIRREILELTDGTVPVAEALEALRKARLKG